jgi:glycerate 2-kinase
MRAHLLQMFQAGIDACHPRKVLLPHLPEVERPVVLAIGKAAGEMAKVAEARYPHAAGIAVVPHGVEAGLDRIELLHAGHPVPDEASVAAAERLLAARGAFVLVLLSGGASALACLPGEGLTLEEKRVLTDKLLRCGAPVDEINCVRRHLSRFKGGRLRADLTLAISDVAGDRPEDIGSGPTVADPTTIADAKAVLERRCIDAPASGWSETPKALDSDFRIVARAADAVGAAAAEAERLGYTPVLLGECNGDAGETGTHHAQAALRAAPGTVLISGGELTHYVSFRAGRGGRNHVYALAASFGLLRAPNIVGLAADTDGLDGRSGAAGAFFDSGTSARAGEDPLEMLSRGLSAHYFAAAGDQLVTGPTGTNVNDLRIILVGH